MKATKQIDIYLTQKRNVRVIDVVQYDTGIQLVFTVKDFAIPSGATATLYVQKPSGKFVYQEDGITASGNTVTINLHNQAITEHGKVPYQVSLKSGSDVITTFTGLMMVEKSLKDAGATESKTVIRAFDEAVSDHVAEFQTKAEQIVQACIATIPEDYTVMEAKVNEAANVVKGYLSGVAVRADDVSPFEGDLSVLAHGKNLLPYHYTETTKTTNGISFTDNGDGTVTVNGTATATTTFNLGNGIPLIGGKTYIMNNYMVISYRNEIGSVKWFIGGHPFVWNEEYTLLQCYLQITSGAKLANVLIRPQIEQGNTDTDWESWIDPTTVTVKRLGKNLLKNEENTQTINGITFTVHDNGTVSATGTATADAVFTIYKRPPLEVGEAFVLSGNPDGASEDKFFMRTVLAWDGVNHTFYDYGTGKEFVVGGAVTAANVSITIKSGVSAIGLLFKPMIRHGSFDSSFEPYTEQTAIPAADGTVPGVTSLSPNMTILTDTEGVIVECEYNRDTNKVIDKLINAITALGGTV
jgi:hypothetical protein